ncbi:MAG: class I SAM-dependent methyltransferase [bacterium]|nr:class I SAM-dependent methyltransferase [bacterium]MCP5069694.1 class I SAM-dependent methyltransferase [bacterium]
MRMPENYFDEDVAADYDATTSAAFDSEVLAPIVDVMVELAEGGPALEFGIGTGRVALPLADRGVDVHGIELSPAMAGRLREKPGSDRIEVTIGDFATTRLDRTFSLVYIVFNTIMNLTTQDEQVSCFANAAAHLRPGGRFVVEVLVPDLRRLPPGQTIQPSEVSSAHIGFDEYTDLAWQQVTSHHHWPGTGRAPVSTPFRYVWPAELDLMARLAGMHLEGRWSDWVRSPFTGDSTAHVSVWRR